MKKLHNSLKIPPKFFDYVCTIFGIRNDEEVTISIEFSSRPNSILIIITINLWAADCNRVSLSKNSNIVLSKLHLNSFPFVRYPVVVSTLFLFNPAFYYYEMKKCIFWPRVHDRFILFFSSTSLLQNGMKSFIAFSQDTFSLFSERAKRIWSYLPLWFDIINLTLE